MEQRGTIMYLEDITVTFDGFQALKEVDFYVDHGELRALIGPNGAGKTTLLDVICGRARPDTGRVIFGQRTDLGKLEEHDITMLGIGRKFQTPTVFRNLTLIDNLTLAMRYRRDVMATLFGSFERSHRDKIHATLQTLGLEEKAAAQAGALSHGEMQWLEIGMVMVQEPALFLLDEPVAGMTREEREKTGPDPAGPGARPRRAGGRARHGIRAPDGPPRDGSARGAHSLRGLGGARAERPEGGRSLSGQGLAGDADD